MVSKEKALLNTVPDHGTSTPFPLAQVNEPGEKPDIHA
jgi:hypothetical protein